MLFPIVTNAQNKLQDSIATAKKYELQVNDTKQKIIGTWYYKNTICHGMQIENEIDSNRVYVFTKKRVTIISNVNGKIAKKKLKYNVYPELEAVAYIQIFQKHKNTNTECLYFVIKVIDNSNLTFDACYNDHYHVTFTKKQ